MISAGSAEHMRIAMSVIAAKTRSPLPCVTPVGFAGTSRGARAERNVRLGLQNHTEGGRVSVGQWVCLFGRFGRDLWTREGFGRKTGEIDLLNRDPNFTTHMTLRNCKFARRLENEGAKLEVGKLVSCTRFCHVPASPGLAFKTHTLVKLRMVIVVYTRHVLSGKPVLLPPHLSNHALPYSAAANKSPIRAGVAPRLPLMPPC